MDESLDHKTDWPNSSTQWDEESEQAEQFEPAPFHTPGLDIVLDDVHLQREIYS